ncbi:MAG: bifunctional riboflavin kinase/FAD synthetase [Myxococcales bacterium]|nr:bifunctional riboflavin kinase/FAD synthetase [Myxococcales bacterium]
MQVIHGTQGLRAPPGPVLTIGNFDGVHLGHQALIRLTLDLAAEIGGPAGVLTFHPAPQDVLKPGRAAPRIQDLEQRLHHLSSTGIDLVIVEPFTLELGALEPEPFARRFLQDRLGVRGLALGHDFRFGRGRAGTVQQLGQLLDVPVRQVDAALQGDRPISSSRIRLALTEGDVAEAARLLGRPHEVWGQVGRGEQRGRTLGFPTANVQQTSGLLPARGVYAVRAQTSAGTVPAVANLGVRPTFDGEQTTLEVHLLDWEGDLYDQRLVVQFADRIREERRFDDAEALVAAIRDDVQVARDTLR